ncbi:MAG: hypothetical protein BEU02_00255 [Marine Group III euryarchaeote CG-Epi5]|uniref:EF-hand domain-containing protein n=1 Tax=Marine Group III euryarchaeote CG-Epi5 TaxID=1888999 RepID=A0A1J5TPV2_9ARCH|nr:MAG: hypothetical protein BEU02_00255 [Marine Group III euryarchaeote CG-Epi5]
MLAVFFMMVMSAFVAVPAYNVSAEDHNGEEHDHDEDNGDHNDHGLPSFSDLDENGNGTIEFNELMTICPEDQSEDQCRGIFDQYSGDDGVIDENEYQRFVSDVTSPDDGPDSMMVCYDIDTHEIDFSITTPEACNEAGLMWVSANSGPNDGDDNWDIENLRVHIKMESLGDWLVTLEVDYPVDESNNFREDLAQFCTDMMGGSGDEITQDCYEQFLMREDDDDHGDHDEWNCPPGLTDDECDMMEDCLDNDMAGMSCQRMMYDYCNDNPNACDSHDDDGNFFYAMFAYEDGDITAEEFMSNNAIQSMFNDDDNDDGTDGGPSDNWGQGKYDLYTFTPEMGGNVKISSHFLMDYIGSPNFICGNGNEIPFYYVNDGSGNCDDGADEQWYDSNTPNDTSDDCQEWNDSDCVGEEVNWFDCHDGTKVWINQVNNGIWNCNDGEDEYHNDYNYWHGNIYLLSGEFMGDDIGTELTPDHVAFMKSEMYYCGWSDDNKTYVDCGNYVDADLVAGNTYTLVTMGTCNTYDEEMDCQTGNYMHTMHMEDGTSMNMSGNVTYDHPMADFSEMMNLNDDSMFGNFVLYDERAFAVGEDGFTGMFMTYGNACEDYDNDGVDDNCYGTSPTLYLYEAFNSSDTESGLVGSAMPIWDDEFDCPDEMQNCTAAMMDVELTPGNYTIVTTFRVHNALFMNMIQTADGVTVSQWDGELRNAHFEHDENSNHTLVEGNDRIYMPYPEYPDYGPECYDEDDNVIDCDDMMDSFALVFAFMENMTAYEDGDMNATVAADNVLGILNAMVDNGFFDRDEDHDDHMSLDSFNVSSWDSANDLEEIVGWYNDQYYNHDIHINMTVGDFLAMCEGISDEVNEEVAQCVLDKALSMIHVDHQDGDHVEWNDFSYCEWEGADWDGDMMWYCDEDGDNTDFEDYWYYCEEHDDSMDSTMFFCTDDFGQSSDYENSASNDHYVTGGRPDEHHDNDDHDDHGDHDDHDNDDHDDHGDHDDNDSDDNPAMLDGIAGIQDPQDAGDNCRPSADDPHLLGSVSDNEDHPLSCSFEFKISFEGVDNSLDTHEAYIPFEDEQVWTLKIEMLEGYEFISCDNCDVDDEGVMTGSGPVKITFAKAEPQPDCDYVVGLSADGMAFDPVKLAIKAGETVCWQWKDASMAHNVLELEGEYDSTMNLTNINFGFSSGEPAMTVDYRHTFTENDKVHYYVCEPHAQLGMVGQITVGNGTEDPVQQALDDNEVPSIGFVVGSLVLVGAAGLRRRIH